MDLVWICIIVGIVGAAVVAYFVRYVLRQDEGPAKLREISAAIKEGGLAFIHREYRTLAIVVVVVAIILAVIPALGWEMAVAFVFGAICSMGAGYAGMNMALRTNGRTCAAAQKGLNQGLRVSFRGGAVMGLTVVSIGIIGLSILYFIWHDLPDYKFLYIIPAYGTGASLVALFARVGGGIFTKGADAGSDLVGKVEAGIPEDDPRNAAVIADNVGDNVGDVCGMGADLFESYVETAVGTMTLTTVGVVLAPWVKGVLFPTLSPEIALQRAWWLPLLIMAAGIAASVIGCFMVRVGEKLEMSALLGALRRGTLTATVLAAVFGFLIIWRLGGNLGLFWAMLAGLVAGALMGEATNYFTSYAFKPTQEISELCHRPDEHMAADSLDSPGYHRSLQVRQLLRCGPRCRGHVIHPGCNTGHRCLWTDSRQCRGHRHSGGVTSRGTREDRCSGLSGEHHGRHRQGIRHWRCCHECPGPNPGLRYGCRDSDSLDEHGSTGAIP